MENSGDYEILEEKDYGFVSILENKYRPGVDRDGKSIGEYMVCDCSYYVNGKIDVELACGRKSNCMNKLLLIECLDDCPSRTFCQNKRFSRKDYAQVTVRKTHGKGMGLFTEEDLLPNSFIIEYVGEVISNEDVLRRSVEYNRNNISHFYFMTLTGGKVIDATYKGNLSRFANHSCNPNCCTQKWTVGNEIRIGLFTLTDIKKGTELTFDYNFENFGSESQICECGEKTCKGTIGSFSVNSRLKQTIVLESGKDHDGCEPEETNANHVIEMLNSEKNINNIIKVENLQKLKSDLHCIALLKPGELQKLVKPKVICALNTLMLRLRKNSEILNLILDVLVCLPIEYKDSLLDSDIQKTLETINRHGENKKVIKILETWNSLPFAYKIPKMNSPTVERSSSDSNFGFDYMFGKLRSEVNLYKDKNDIVKTNQYPSTRSLPYEYSESYYMKNSYVNHDRDLKSTSTDGRKYLDKDIALNIVNKDSIKSIIEEANIEMQSNRASYSDLSIERTNYVKLRSQISELVRAFLNNYKKNLTNEGFKKLARKLTHTIISKEINRCGNKKQILETLGESSKDKINEYLNDYIKQKGYEVFSGK